METVRDDKSNLRYWLKVFLLFKVSLWRKLKYFWIDSLSEFKSRADSQQGFSLKPQKSRRKTRPCYMILLAGWAAGRQRGARGSVQQGRTCSGSCVSPACPRCGQTIKARKDDEEIEAPLFGLVTMIYSLIWNSAADNQWLEQWGCYCFWSQTYFCLRSFVLRPLRKTLQFSASCWGLSSLFYGNVSHHFIHLNSFKSWRSIFESLFNYGWFDQCERKKFPYTLFASKFSLSQYYFSVECMDILNGRGKKEKKDIYSTFWLPRGILSCFKQQKGQRSVVSQPGGHLSLCFAS